MAEEVSSTVGLIYEYTASGTYIGSGSVIASSDSGSWVITAAHVVQDATALSFKLNGVTYYADSWDYYSYVTDETLALEGVGDIAVFHINTEIHGAVPAALYTGETLDLLGLTATYSGYGCTGTGLTGYTSYSSGTLHAVQNTFDATAAYYWTSGSSSVLMSDFDSPIGTSSLLSASVADSSLPLLPFTSDTATDLSSDNTAFSFTTTGLSTSTPLEYEGLIAPGDSGGGVFVTIDGITYLAGVNSFGTASDGEIDSDYGDYSGCVSVCDFIDWLTETTGRCYLRIPGDANEDGVVNGSDATILAENWQYGVGMENPDALWSMGDFNYDGIVDGSDATILADNWLYDVNSETALTLCAMTAATVPEPSVWLLLACLPLLIHVFSSGRQTSPPSSPSGVSSGKSFMK